MRDLFKKLVERMTISKNKIIVVFKGGDKMILNSKTHRRRDEDNSYGQEESFIF